jgi:hypothetical protein
MMSNKLPAGYDSWLTTDPSLEEPIDESLYGWVQAIDEDIRAVMKGMNNWSLENAHVDDHTRQKIDDWVRYLSYARGDLHEILESYEELLKNS